MIRAIFANISCTDLKKSTVWYAALFARQPDVTPMEGLAEWHHGTDAGFQLRRNEEGAGHCVLTLIVEGIRAERSRLSQAGLNPGSVEEADYTIIVRLNDPDGNLVVLAENKTS